MTHLLQVPVLLFLIVGLFMPRPALSQQNGVFLEATAPDRSEQFTLLNAPVPVNYSNQLAVNFTGQIRLKNGDGIPDVTVQLFNDPNTLLGGFQNQDNGLYVFNPDDFPVGPSTYVLPSKDQNPLDGVSTFDVVLIDQYFNNNASVENPCLYLAADINRDNLVNKADMLELRKLILGISTFPDNLSWRFFPADHVFPPLGNPLSNLPDRKYIVDFDSPDDGDFIGVKLGDLNGTAGNNFGPEDFDTRSEGGELSVRRFDQGDCRVQAGEEIALHFLPDADLSVIQGTLSSDQLIWTGIEALNGMSAEHFGQFEHAVTFSWNGLQNQGFVLYGRVLQDGNWPDFIRLSENITPIEAYRANERAGLSLRTNCGQGDASLRWLYNAPNPFRERTQVHFYLPAARSVNCTVFDPLGKVVMESKRDCAAGENTFVLDWSEAAASGLYIVRLQTPEESISTMVQRQ